ncbi:MAG: MBL fold metallo-hydrolase [Deltaproteobacteria bacterium]|nr:MBL fold metallo-hydrolase [Deltaproteobacteria bacterium]
MIVETLAVGPFQSNCIILGCPVTRHGVVIDPGAEGERIVAAIERNQLKIQHILLTHAHLDHVAAVAALRRATQAPVALHPADRWLYDHVPMQGMMFGLRAEAAPPLDAELQDGQVVAFGEEQRVEVIHTPGHSPGGVCFHLPAEKLAVVGDTLFHGSIGRTDLWGGDYGQLIRSITDRLLVLDPSTRLITGHGPDATVAREKRGNPFLGG